MSATTMRSATLGFIVFLVMGVATMLLSWHIVAATGVEAGDFAANSILIQSAKHLRLTLGNYSRVGFNHPGPAILYVLAAGEWAFHDALGSTTSIGGQILAACLYNAAWFGIAAGLLNRFGLGVGRTLVAMTVTAAVIALREPRAFDNVWFPYLYVMPFLAFTVALAGVFRGDPLAWLGTALSAGFLVNGHVSFAGVCGVAVAAATVAWAVRTRDRAVAWPLAGAAVFTAFLVPLMVREIAHNPGPTAEYVFFARNSEAHGLGETLRFVSSRFGATAFEVAAALGAVVFLATRRADPLARGVALSVAATSAGTFVYAVRGVDSLSFDYVLIFFGVVPALAIGIALAGSLPRDAGRWVFVVAVASALLWAAAIRGDVGMPDYDRPDVPSVDAALLARGDGLLAIDLTISPDYGRLWSTFAGVEAERLRRGAPIGFCIATGWHILFTKIAQCGPLSATLPHIRVDVARANTPQISVAFAAGGLEFFDDLASKE